jgi:hypothetical protein
MELETNEPPYDPTSVVLVPSDFSAATLDQHQIDGCLNIVYYYYGSECADITTPTQLLHAICETEAPKGHPFFSESDFHHSLMQVKKFGVRWFKYNLQTYVGKKNKLELFKLN